MISGQGCVTIAYNDPNDGSLVLAANNTYSGGTYVLPGFMGANAANTAAGAYSIVVGDGLTTNGCLPGNLLLNPGARFPAT